MVYYRLRAGLGETWIMGKDDRTPASLNRGYHAVRSSVRHCLL